jgi:hypothetical protein
MHPVFLIAVQVPPMKLSDIIPNASTEAIDLITVCFWSIAFVCLHIINTIFYCFGLCQIVLFISISSIVNSAAIVVVGPIKKARRGSITATSFFPCKIFFVAYSILLKVSNLLTYTGQVNTRVPRSLSDPFELKLSNKSEEISVFALSHILLLSS